jgi:hypothetical protein
MGPQDQATLQRAVLAARLDAQRITRPGPRTAQELVKWLGALQAQDYAGAKWAIGLRLGSAATEMDIERAIAEGHILRTHLMRWTWQFVLPEDVRWMLDLVRDRLVVRASRRHRQLELDAATFCKSNDVLDQALRDGGHATRDELAARLEKAGISPAGERLSHLLGRAELDAVLCSGARRGKQFTYMHLDHRAPRRRTPWQRDEAVAELARRYFQSRGPATLADFVWWSGLTIAEARAGLDAIRSSLVTQTIDGDRAFSLEENRAKTKRTAGSRYTERLGCQLLPAFDEYLVAYRKRDAILAARDAKRLNAGGGMLRPSVVFDGRVIGTWRRELTKGGVAIELHLFEHPSRIEQATLTRAVETFGRFLGLAAEIAGITAYGKKRTAPRPPATAKRSTTRSRTPPARVRPRKAEQK